MYVNYRQPSVIYFLNIYWYFSVFFISFLFLKGFVILHVYLSLGSNWILCKACGIDCGSLFDCRYLIVLAWRVKSGSLPLSCFCTFVKTQLSVWVYSELSFLPTDWCVHPSAPLTHATAVTTEVLKSSALVPHMFIHFQNCSGYSSSLDFHFLLGQSHLYLSNVLLGFS